MRQLITQLRQRAAAATRRGAIWLPALLVVLAIGPVAPLACIAHCLILPHLVATPTHHHHWIVDAGQIPAHLHGEGPGELPPPPPALYEFVLALVMCVGVLISICIGRAACRTDSAPQRSPIPPTPPPRAA